MTTQPIETTDRAWKLLESEGTDWCQNAIARDITSSSVTYNDPSACAWCTIGAINKVYGPIQALEAQTKLATYLTGKLNSPDVDQWDVIVNWNDAPGQQYEQVISILKQLDI